MVLDLDFHVFYKRKKKMSNRTTLENMMGDDNTVDAAEQELLDRFVQLQMTTDPFIVLVPNDNHEGRRYWDVCDLDTLSDESFEYDDSVIASAWTLEAAISDAEAAFRPELPF